MPIDIIEQMLTTSDFAVTEMGNVLTRRLRNGGGGSLSTKRGPWREFGYLERSIGRWVLTFNCRRVLRSRFVFYWFNGPISNSIDIHHKDENRLNDDPLNLDAQTRAEHNSLHHKGRPKPEAWAASNANWNDPLKREKRVEAMRQAWVRRREKQSAH